MGPTHNNCCATSVLNLVNNYLSVIDLCFPCGCQGDPVASPPVRYPAGYELLGVPGLFTLHSEARWPTCLQLKQRIGGLPADPVVLDIDVGDLNTGLLCMILF